MSHRGIRLTVQIQTNQGWKPILVADSDMLSMLNEMQDPEAERDLLGLTGPVRIRIMAKSVQLPDEYAFDESALEEGEE
jgi:hypothetical protein